MATLRNPGVADPRGRRRAGSRNGGLAVARVAGIQAANLTAVLVTHLHSDHITDLGDLITAVWIGTFEPTPLNIVGPPGIAAVVEAILASLGSDICYRMAHHDDLTERPMVSVTEVTNGPVPLPGPVRVSCAPTDHRPADPSIGFRFDHEGAAVVTAGDTVPCAGLDGLCQGAQALVHTAIRKDVIAEIPIPRLLDVLDYHSSPEEAAQTAQRAAMDTLVLTHYMPAFPSGGGEGRRAGGPPRARGAREPAAPRPEPDRGGPGLPPVDGRPRVHPGDARRAPR